MAEVLEIECSLRLRTRYNNLFREERSARTKAGSYHGSYFWGIKGFGSEKWVVILTVERVDIDHYLQEGLTDEEIVKGCISYLNKPAGKRKKKQLYGNLELMYSKLPSWEEGSRAPRFTIREEEGIKTRVLLATTDERTNKNFWGKGHKVPRSFKSRR